MEDGFPLFDPNDEAARQEQRLREYYEEFSANARKRLLSKIVVRPTSVYDVLYPSTREALLAKNVPFNTDLEKDAKIIRDRLIAKLVTEETDLEKISADFRNSLLARAKIQDDRDRLTRDGDAFRKNLIAKNSPKDTDLERDSSQARVSNISKNRQDPSAQDDISENSSAFRDAAISKNNPKEQDLLNDSEGFRNQFRKNDIHKNVPIKTNLEEDSLAFRNKNLSKNSDKPHTIDDISDLKRKTDLSKNYIKPKDVDESVAFRNDDLSKNSSKDQDLLRDSEGFRNQFRINDINKNVPNNSNIELDSDAFRRNNIAKNVDKKSDLENDSVIYRKSNTAKDIRNQSTANPEEIAEAKRIDSLSKNVPSPSDLLKDSKDFREDDLSKNVISKSDIERDSESFRKDDLAANKGKVSDLEVDSASFRKDDLSANKGKTSDLEVDSAPFRIDDLAANKLSKSNLEKDSVNFREDDLSKNKASITDLESDSVIFRKDDLSKNKAEFSDLETDSVQFRVDDLSANIPSISNLETDSVVFRADDLAANVPSISNLEVDSVPFRNDDLAANVLSTSDLETDSVIFREDDLSANVPSTSDLEIDSVPFRNDDLAANVLSTSDLEVDSIVFRNDDLAANVPSFSDLATDSAPFRVDDLAANVPSTSDLLIDSAPFRVDDLAANNPTTSNLLVDSAQFRVDDLAANVPSTSNLLIDSAQLRADDLAANVPFNTDLLSDSSTYRNDAISKNKIYGLLGVNIEGAGTSAFIGISRVFTQGILIRELLFSKNEWQIGNNEYTSTSTNFNLGKIMQGSVVSSAVDYTLLQPYTSPVSKALLSTDDYLLQKGFEIQSFYGTSQTIDFPTGKKDYSISDAMYSTNPLSPRGGSFFDASVNRQTSKPYREGTVTSAIRSYNQERNTFNLKSLQPGNPETINILNQINSDGFQELISDTIGAFSTAFQGGTNTTPASIIVANNGSYFKGGERNTDLMKPGAENANIGTAESMMAKTSIGNPFEDEDFFTGKRGVKHIINTIKKSDSKLAANFDPQNNTAYINGMNRDGSPKVSRQKYTIANPYAPSDAGKLVFFIKNYASGDQFFFPPYIQSISNTENASWNTTNFLGRPEAVYTYNNSSRDASISFYVLTDYSQTVDIGRDWASETMDKVSVNIDKHFTDSDQTQNASRRLQEQRLQKLRDEQTVAVTEINEKLAENSTRGDEINQRQSEVSLSGSVRDNTTVADEKRAKEATERSFRAEDRYNKAEQAALTTEKERLSADLGRTEKAAGSFDEKFNTETNYSETNIVGDNVYNINVTKNEFVGGEIITKPDDTITRINTMKESLMFQPAFFSGDKVDFVRKVEFLSKLTRPAAAHENDDVPRTGFSFTKPPICHIHLGDWWNHDIVVNSVGFDYANAPWTLEGGRVQPMWVLVTISFNIIGPFRSHSGRPPLATDVGGMYSPVGGVTKA